MTTKEKVTLVEQARKLYTLGLTLENYRQEIRRLVHRNIPYDSPQMKDAVFLFQTTEEEWRRLEQEYLEYRQSLFS